MKTQQWLQKYPLVTMVVAYIVITLVSGLKANDSLGADVAWTAIAAVATILAVLLLAPFGFQWGSTRESLKDEWVKKALRWLGIAAVVACVANFAILIWGNGEGANEIAAAASAEVTQDSAPSLFESDTSQTSAEPLSLPTLVALLVACCFTTAVFEEGFFRGIVVPCAKRRTQLELEALQKGEAGRITLETYNQMTDEEKRETQNVPYSAAVFSGLLFGVVHMFSGSIGFAGSSLPAIGLMAVMGIAKAVQAGFFGYVMAAFMMRTGSVYGPMIVHFFFDLLYFAPVILLTGNLPVAYATGSLPDLLMLALIIAALVPATRAASTWLKEQ